MTPQSQHHQHWYQHPHAHSVAIIIVSRLLGGNKEAAPATELIQLPSGSLYLIRPSSIRGSRECIYTDALAIIRRAGSSSNATASASVAAAGEPDTLTYEPAIPRAYDADNEGGAQGACAGAAGSRGASAPGSDNGGDDDERVFIIDQDLLFREAQTQDGDHTFVWRDPLLAGNGTVPVDDEDLLKFVIDDGQVNEVTHNMFLVIFLQCAYEHKFRKSHEEASDQDLEALRYEREQASQEQEEEEEEDEFGLKADDPDALGAQLRSRDPSRDDSTLFAREHAAILAVRNANRTLIIFCKRKPILWPVLPSCSPERSSTKPKVSPHSILLFNALIAATRRNEAEEWEYDSQDSSNSSLTHDDDIPAEVIQIEARSSDGSDSGASMRPFLNDRTTSEGSSSSDDEEEYNGSSDDDDDVADARAELTRSIKHPNGNFMPGRRSKVCRRQVDRRAPTLADDDGNDADESECDSTRDVDTDSDADTDMDGEFEEIGTRLTSKMKMGQGSKARPASKKKIGQGSGAAHQEGVERSEVMADPAAAAGQADEGLCGTYQGPSMGSAPGISAEGTDDDDRINQTVAPTDRSSRSSVVRKGTWDWLAFRDEQPSQSVDVGSIALPEVGQEEGDHGRLGVAYASVAASSTSAAASSTVVRGTWEWLEFRDDDPSAKETEASPQAPGSAHQNGAHQDIVDEERVNGDSLGDGGHAKHPVDAASHGDGAPHGDGDHVHEVADVVMEEVPPNDAIDNPPSSPGFEMMPDPGFEMMPDHVRAERLVTPPNSGPKAV
ncbi:Vacuolar import and degradation protein 27 [Tilletia horrida]|nr:Vacuolar import and degradation protein 27 [Tilletia horrida]